MSQFTDRDASAVDARRRRLLGAASLVAPMLWLPSLTARASTAPRAVRLYHTHTGERLSLTYHENGDYIAGALEEINRFLRDFRSGEVHAINPVLLDRLDAMRARAQATGPYQVISGFRSASTNAMLRGRSNSSGVAKKSLHMTGNALDIRLAGVDTRTLRDIAKSLRAGGVGYYARSDFVHIDTGRTRAW